MAQICLNKRCGSILGFGSFIFIVSKPSEIDYDHCSANLTDPFGNSGRGNLPLITAISAMTRISADKISVYFQKLVCQLLILLKELPSES